MYTASALSLQQDLLLVHAARQDISCYVHCSFPVCLHVLVCLSHTEPRFHSDLKKKDLKYPKACLGFFVCLLVFPVMAFEPFQIHSGSKLPWKLRENRDLPKSLEHIRNVIS